MKMAKISAARDRGEQYGLYGPLAILSGTANPELAVEVAERLNQPLCNATISQFANQNIFAKHPEHKHPARSWVALVSVLDARRLNPRDLGITSLKGSWVARELGCLNTEEELLGLADAYLDDALRRGLTKGDPGMVMYLLGEINRRRRELRRAKEMLTFLGNNPRYRYPALLLTVLIEEEDSTPYWSHYAPDRMEQHSPVFKGLFPALRSIPPNKIQFSANELRDDAERSDEDDRQSF